MLWSAQPLQFGTQPPGFRHSNLLGSNSYNHLNVEYGNLQIGFNEISVELAAAKAAIKEQRSLWKDIELKFQRDGGDASIKQLHGDIWKLGKRLELQEAKTDKLEAENAALVLVGMGEEQ